MNRAELVLRTPVITEKSTLLKENMQTLAFKVLRDANKIEIKDAVEKIFKVKVASVRTANFHGKKKRQGKYVGRRSDWKKAYVTLKEGEKMIEFSEAL
ncbi:MAG: 50S ribosomal protein L23 [Acidobacteriota bacterium]|jgi:large subunit ribosomal protein L23|nr:50S ribosomal protein L23 [Acidobacteriota bacterium]